METVTIDLLSSQAEYQQYKPADTSLINTATIAPPFGASTDYIEYFIYDTNGDLLVSEYYDTNYTPVNPDPATGNYTALQIDPQADVASHGYDRGSVDISYNFFRNLFQSSYTNQFWIKQISGTRTELKVCRQDLSNQQLQQAFTDFENQAASRAYYSDFYLNFGNNEVLIGVNVAYALDGDQGCLLLKLYEPLSAGIDLKSTFWLVEQLGDSVKYQVIVEIPASAPPPSNSLKGPNFNLNIAQRVGQSTPTYNLSTLLASSSLTPSSSLYQQMQSVLQDTSIDINVDYSDFSNFVHFSSAQERIYNFAYKLKLIEGYNQSITNAGKVLNGGTIASGSVVTYQQQINDIITNFDGYEYYLYFENTPQAWPKSNNLPPYQLYSITSSQALTWLGNPDIAPPEGQYSALSAASTYDLSNKDWLINTIPEYLKQDDSNIPYQTFLNMIGQHFDNIWIYYKDVTERYDAESNLTKGVSKELVKSALESFGIHLYTNTNISDNLYYSTLGINPDGSLTPPTGSYYSGSIYITYNSSGPYVFPDYTVPNLYTLNYDEKPTIPGADITLEYQKRIYHNLPYLLKTKGTTRGLRALINCFGIPDTLLRINEFGGSDKLASTPDVIQKRYGLAYHNTGSTNLALPWAPQVLNNALPDTVEFRFKTDGIPDSNHISQSLFEVNRNNNTYFGLQLTYDSASAIPSSSLQNNGRLTFYLNSSGSIGIYKATTPITLPFFDKTQWWSVMLQRTIGQAANNVENTYKVTVAGAAYNQEGDNNITYIASQSLAITGSATTSYNGSWNAYDTGSQTNLFSAYLGGPVNLTSSLCKNRTAFQGYYQEFRYWGQPLTTGAFNQHVISPSSIAGNTVNSSYTDLTFRLPLGSNNVVPSYGTGSVQLNSPDGDLYRIGFININQNTVLTSNHPAIETLKSFKSGSSSFSYGLFGSGSRESESNALFESVVMTDLIAGPSVGVGQKVNNKISTGTQSELNESLLSPFISIQRYNPDISRNSADIEVGFSPSDLVDADITNQLGYFNIDDYIGDPSNAYLDNYPDLDTLRNTYFRKYISKFDLPDFINLIRFFDNSLFKMIKDFVPARADLSTGIIVKPHILERSKYPRNEPTVTVSNNTSSVDLIDTSGSNPEGYYLNTGYTQSVPVSFYVAPGYEFQTIQPSVIGNITSPQSKLKEPFTGEFGGLDINLTNHGQFSQLERSSIIAPWTSSISTGQSIFTTYNLGGLYENAVNGVTSSIFLETDYSYNVVVPVNNGIVTNYFTSGSSYRGYVPFATITDSNYSSKAFTGIRYIGNKTTSAKYNTYTVGDNSYGKTAAIDRKSYKVGWVKNISSQSLNFYDKTQVNLKYLVDADVRTLELNHHNSNLFEVQNIFKSGDPVIISLSNPNSPSKQRSLDGFKIIWKGGFSYDPILFRENNEPLTFIFDSPISSASVNLGFNAYSPYTLYYTKVDGQSPTPPSYLFGAANSSTVIINDQQISNQSIALGIPSSNWQYNGNGPLVDFNNYDANGNNLGAFNRNGTGTAYGFQLPLFSNISVQSPFLQNGNAYSYEDPSVFRTLNGSTIYTVPRTSTYNISGTVSISVLFHAYEQTVNLKLVGILEISNTPDLEGSWSGLKDNSGKLICTVLNEQGPHATGHGDDQVSFDFTVDTYMNHIRQSGTTDSGPDLFLCKLPLTSVTLQAGSSLRFKFYWLDLQDGCFTGAFNVVQFTLGDPNYTYLNIIDTLAVETLYQNSLTYSSTIPLFTTASATTLQFAQNTQQFFSQSCIFAPTGSTADYYSNVIDSFSIQQGDLIRLGNFYSSLSKTYEVISANTYQKAPITINASIRSIIPSGVIHSDGRNYSTYIQYQASDLPGDPSSYFSPGDLIQISGSAYLPAGTGVYEYNHNITTLFPVLSAVFANSQKTLCRVYLDNIYFSETPIYQGIYDTARYQPGLTNNPILERTVTFNTFTKVSLDTPITNWSPFDSQNFAILRQKPDETSVLVDYIKQPGEVSPALLVPYDANTNIIAAQSTIFTTLNPSLI